MVEIAYGGGYYDKRTISYLPLNTSNVVLAGSFLFKANTNVAGYRLISSASNDKIVFSYGSDTANARNDNLGIPTRIWGVKFTL